MKFESQYKQLLMRCLLKGDEKKARNGNTTSLFSENLKINLNEGFPIVTGKKIFFKKALGEFLWIWGGRTDIKFLNEYGIKWWDDYSKNGEVVKSYGYQVKNYNGEIDQIQLAFNELKNYSRRAVISLWNPSDIKDQALPCCYTQLIYNRVNDKLNLQVNFRSSDLFLGLPYDICVMALFLISMAKKLDLKPNILACNLTDAHIYDEHKNQVLEYYKRPNYTLPEFKDGKLENYKHGELIKAELIL